MLKGPAAEKTGLIIARILVPLWILTGALFKLIAQTPSTLPKFTIFSPWAMSSGHLLLRIKSMLERMTSVLADQSPPSILTTAMPGSRTGNGISMSSSLKR